MDGVRVWCVIKSKDNIKYLSRNGKEYPNFSVFNTEVYNASILLINNYNYQYPIIFDGEVVTSESDFQEQMQDVRRLKNAKTDHFRFNVFDIVDSTKMFKERYKILTQILGIDKVNYVIHFDLDIDLVHNLLEEALNKGYEGFKG
jgi:ATP-dependent DNA ligase